VVSELVGDTLITSPGVLHPPSHPDYIGTGIVPPGHAQISKLGSNGHLEGLMAHLHLEEPGEPFPKILEKLIIKQITPHILLVPLQCGFQP